MVSTRQRSCAGRTISKWSQRETIPMSHVKQNAEPQEKRGYKRRRRDVPECSKCEVNPALPNQRYCRDCKNAAARTHYWKKKRELQQLREMRARYVQEPQP